ncbi:enoyl-ACP reductase FabV [Paenibacillus pasadenensis]|uniref:Trans-2-enoyl-CoA reductase [NADH] n=1 Tax=Paenibacillus pasadenensis TaxID=217090 RepID=A0A2N5N4L2_9BACL|nr:MULTISPECIES: enoyl-ACP reductase FabV [Paenibacillus]PLT45285.1 Short-chain alcohol dehydrogenase family [Paenibacillus pasadenensis]QGG55689.1 enoyl-[acyl-carrier-protein] reductase FabV [Paenibacillus sp. B01]
MIIKPRTRGFICTTAHPEGCARQVREQIEYIQQQPRLEGPKRALVLGASTGYGLSARIALAFGAGAATVGVFRPSAATDKRTASPGWYNSAAFEREAAEAGLTSISVTGDAFADETKDKVIETIREELGQVDLVVYSVAAPRRTDPDTGETFSSTLKPIGDPYTNKTVNFHTGEVSEVTIEPAEDDDIRQTVAVMGGADWQRWITRLQQAGVLAEGAVTIAYSYIGSSITQAIYREGTIGKAKDDLEATALELQRQLAPLGGRAYVSVSKALVTQSSSAIPVVPLYVSALYKVMKDKGLHENTIQQTARLFELLYADGGTPLDEKGRIRIDDWELRADVQDEVARIWAEVDSSNIDERTDLEGYRKEFFQLFGFETAGVDYEQDADPIVDIPSAR